MRGERGTAVPDWWDELHLRTNLCSQNKTCTEYCTPFGKREIVRTVLDCYLMFKAQLKGKPQKLNLRDIEKSVKLARDLLLWTRCQKTETKRRKTFWSALEAHQTKRYLCAGREFL